MFTIGYRWYVEPLDSHTNKVFAENIPPMDAYENMKTVDGPKDVWECRRSQIRSFVKSARDLNLRFNVFSQRGNGQIREVNFLFFSN